MISTASFFTFMIFIKMSLQDAATFTCQGNHVIQPTANINDTYWYPNNYGNDVPVFSSNQKCTFQILVPNGMFATLTLAVHIPNDALCYTIDYNDVSDSYQNVNRTLNFFIQPGANLHLILKDNPGRFGFSIHWENMPQKFDPVSYNVSKDQSQPLVSYNAYTFRPNLFTADTRVSIVSLLPYYDHSKDSDTMDLLRSVLVYDGADMSSKCLGNLYNLLKSERQWVSTGKQLTVYRLTKPYDLLYYLIQDYTNTMGIVEYKTISPYYYWAAVSLSATNGSAAFFTYSHVNRPDYLVAANIDQNAILDIYSGGKTADKSNLLVSYDKDSIKNSLTQQIVGTVRTYVLSNGTATLNLTSGPYGSGFDTAYDGRKGFIASQYYKTSYMFKQSDQITITGKTKTSEKYFNFTYSIRDADLSKKANLTIFISNEKTGNVTRYYNETNLPAFNEPIESTGYAMQVYFEAFSSSAKGFYMDFKMQEVKSANNNNILKIFVIMIVFILY